MKLLLDTNVLSEARRPEGAPLIKHWVRNIPPQDAFTSALVAGEIARGIARLGPGRRQAELREWFARLRLDFGVHLLTVTADVAEFWGERFERRRAKGRVVPLSDGLIAATARVHGLYVATRNVPDMLEAGAAVFNPWTGETHEPVA